ncbi:MAG: hypothetical protein SFY56_16355 [Bacteroidota bacterium]|nr:hypothetical protein [Bacteroidota bacterium]
MKYFIESLKYRNEALFIFGTVCLLFAIIFISLTRFSNIEVSGVNAWYKPFKFALSTVFYAWAMAWFCYYLPPSFNLKLFNWTVIILLGFEIAYIAFQAGRGQLSHFNISNSLYATLYSLMAIAATVVTLYTAYVGILFFTNQFPDLPNYYVWSIRIAIFIFVIFALEGFVMGSRMAHTVGGSDGAHGIPVLNWSKKFGDPRIAHFIGMHALQVIPVLSYYLLRNTKLTIALGIVYFALAIFTLMQALKGKPLFKTKNTNSDIYNSSIKKNNS